MINPLSSFPAVLHQSKWHNFFQRKVSSSEAFKNKLSMAVHVSGMILKWLALLKMVVNSSRLVIPYVTTRRSLHITVTDIQG
jgi:hypothetical protein